MPDRIDRRSFLARGAAVGVGIAAMGATGGILDACSSVAGSSSGTSGANGHPNGISTATPNRGGALIFGTEAEEKGFSTTQGTFDTTGILYARTVFDPLAIIAADGSVQPYLAESITPNLDYTVWTITMRPNLVFHNGTPCDGAAVAENFALQQASSLTGAALTTIADVSVPSSLVVTVTMKSPWVPFDFYLAGGIGGQISFIAEPNWLKSGSQTNPIGTGPFVFEAWNPNDHFTAIRNPHYWRPNLPYLDSITYKPIPDADQLLASLQSGGVDVMHTSFSQVTGSLRSDTSLGYTDDSVRVAGEPDMLCLLLNLSKPPFDNLKVRQAAAMAVSSPEYSKVIENGICPPSSGPFGEGSPYFASTGYPGPAPTTARQLIKEVQHESGRPVSITLNHTPDPSATRDAEYFQAQLQGAGMQVTLSTVQQAEIISTAVLGTFEAQLWRQFGAVHPDLNYIFWSPTNAGQSGFAVNMARNADPRMEAALLKGRQSAVPSEAAEAYQEVGRLMGADIPYIWTARAVWSIGAQPKVENWNNPTTPGGKPGYGMITGAIWPTQIWLSR
ncbi:MAG: ABC transporter substrate-binding protein [Acidimicrobiales bacterium]|jgi:peptide/nickel transport system substrate-binding protein